MCRLRRALTPRRWRSTALAVLIGLVAPAYLCWCAEESRKGTLALDCPDDAFAVEICTDRPPTTWELISGPDARPQWSTWGQPSPEVGSRRCVWFREVERTAL